MKAIHLVCRIILAPAALLLTAICFLLALLLALSTRVLAIVSSIGVTLALLLFVTGDDKNGGIFLLLAFAIWSAADRRMAVETAGGCARRHMAICIRVIQPGGLL